MTASNSRQQIIISKAPLGNKIGNNTVDKSTVDAFQKLFKGREDAWGSVEGRSNKEPVTRELYKAHLEGKTSLGIYPLLDDGTCNFFGIDQDRKDTATVLAIRQEFNHLGLSVYCADSKSKGHHIFGFADPSEPFVAKEIRRVCFYVLDKVKAQCEVFPKQDFLDPEMVPLGNYINLPCFGTTRQFFTRELKTVPIEEAVKRILTISKADVEEALKIVPPPVIPKMVVKKVRGARRGEAAPCIEAMLKGVPSGARDVAAFALARHFLDQQYTEGKALELLQTWDKKNNPPLNDDHMLEAKVGSAAKGYSFGCSSITKEPLLASYCIGESKCGRMQQTTHEKEKNIYQSYFHYECLYLEIQKHDGDYCFACMDGNGKVELHSDVTIGEKCIKPRPLPQIEGKAIAAVGLPDEDIVNCELLGPLQLYQEIKLHLATYIDLPKLDLELCVYYILFTWFYTKVNTLGYLRFLADTGKGKSRAQKVVGDVCFFPVFASGASTLSGIARLNKRWCGTLIIDEADIGGDKEHQFVKYLNLGFERGKYYVLSDKQNPKFQEYFDPFSPKILAMRQPFKDNATEGRLLSISPHETLNPDIPVLLPQQYLSKTQQLRNKLAVFTLHHFDKIDSNRMIQFNESQLEPRIRQLAIPLSIIFQIWPDGIEPFKEYLICRQKEIKKIRSLSWEGSMVNLVYSIAVGDQDVRTGFSSYYKPESRLPQTITPTMVAQQIKSSAKSVTQSLMSVGFEVEWRWITTYTEGKELRKRVRAYCIPDSQTWREIVSRYYYSEDESELSDAPEILRSTKYRMCVTVPNVPNVPDKAKNSGVGTGGTD